MRKWICIGVILGLLEFGIVYQVAFSEADAPSPEASDASENGPRSNSPKLARQAVKAPDHPAGDTAVVGGDSSQKPAAPAASPAKKAATPAQAAPGGPPVPGPENGSPAGTAETDPLATLLATASSVAGKVAVIPLALTGPVPPGAAPGGDLAEVLAFPGAPANPAQAPVPAPAPKPVDLASLPVEDMIRKVFGPEGEKAVQVARCESTMRTQAKRGQFRGLFQMGENERADYGHGPDALAQVLAAHALFLDRGWQPWACA